MPTALWLAFALAAPGTATDQARALTRRSILEYDTGAYAKALADIEQAYELDPRPALLYNVAQCQRALGHHREAALAFKSYLRALPNARNRALAEGLAAQMEQLATADEAPKAQPNPPPVVVVAAPPPEPIAIAPPPPPPLPVVPEAAVSEAAPTRHLRAGAWWLGGSGLAVAVVGTVLFAVAESALGGDHPQTVGGVVEHGLSSGSYFMASTEGNVGEALWAVGGALLVGGAVVALTGGSN